MRLYCNINATPRDLVSGLGSNLVKSTVELKRRDAADIELQLFTGEQGSARPYKLPELFEMRFAAKVEEAWSGEPVVFEGAFAWKPLEQCYVASPNFNTEQLHALFAAEGEEPEPDAVTLMAEFTWRDLAYPTRWTSTSRFTLIVHNDVIRGDEADPSNAEEPTLYVTRAELDAGYVRTNEAQSLTSEMKAQARVNIGALADGEVVKVLPQTLTPTEATQARENIGAAAAEDLAATDAAATALSAIVEGKADASALTALGLSLTALSNAAIKKTAQTLSSGEKAIARANIGAAAAVNERVFTRLAASFNPVGNNSTTVHLNGALNAVSGTAAGRSVSLLASGLTISSYTGSTITRAAHGGVDGQPCQFTATLMPAGLTAGVWYYLRDVTTDTFAVAATPGGTAITLSGSFTAWQVQLASAPFYRHRRIGFNSSGTAGTVCGTRHNALQWAVSADPALGGWIYSARFGISDAAAVANARLFVGMAGRASGAALPNANPSTNVNIIGVGADTGDTTLHILHNDASGTATRVDLGVDFPANTRNTDMYELVLTCNADLSVTYKVTHLGSGAVAQGNLATDLPMPLQLLAPQIWRSNGTTAVSARIDVVQWTLEQVK